MSNITVITLNKFRKRVRGLLRTRISSFKYACCIFVHAIFGSIDSMNHAYHWNIENYST